MKNNCKSKCRKKNNAEATHKNGRKWKIKERKRKSGGRMYVVNGNKATVNGVILLGS